MGNINYHPKESMVSLLTRAAISIVALLSFGIVFFILNQSPWANGKDAYWYLVQLQSWIIHGKLHSFEATPIYLLLAGTHAIFSDLLLSYRLMLAVVILFASTGVYFVFINLAPEGVTKVFKLLVAFIIFFSPTIMITGIQYPKQLFAEGVLLFAAGFWIRYKRKTERGALCCAIGLALLAGMSHRLVAGLLIVYLVTRVIRNLFSSFHWKYLELGFLLFAFSVVLSTRIPGILHWMDWERLADSFTIHGILPAFLLINLFHFTPLLVFESFSLFVVISYFIFSKNWSKEFPSLVWLLLFLHVPLFDFFDLQIRFVLAANLLNYLILFPLFIHLSNQNNIKKLFQKSSNLGGSSLGLQKKYHFWTSFTLKVTGYEKWQSLYIVMVFLGITNFILLFTLYDPAIFENQYGFATKIIEKSKPFIHETNPELMILHKGFDKFLEMKMGRDVLAWSPDAEMDQTKIVRFVYDIQKEEIYHILKEFVSQNELFKNIYVIDNKYLLIREDLWQQFVLSALKTRDEELQQRIYFWKNPQKQRPKWIKKSS